jgi:hypothetical protein
MDRPYSITATSLHERNPTKLYNMIEGIYDLA